MESFFKKSDQSKKERDNQFVFFGKGEKLLDSSFWNMHTKVGEVERIRGNIDARQNGEGGET
jgi:hypothetical protein